MSRHYEHVMVDLETLGTKPGATILSIGAVGFDATGVSEDRFHVVLHRADSAALGFVEDVATLTWWAKQGPAAQETLRQADEAGFLVPEALTRFARYLVDASGTDDRGRLAAKVWGNGSDFDNVLLAAAYQRCGLPLPWPFFNNRCFRTLKGLRLASEPTREGTHHNALDDAVHQARWAVRCLRQLEPDAVKDVAHEATRA